MNNYINKLSLLYIEQRNYLSGLLEYDQIYYIYISRVELLGCVAQSVTCLATDASLAADPGVASSIPTRSHTYMEIDYDIIYMVILLPSAESFKKDCCQLQVKVCA